MLIPGLSHMSCLKVLKADWGDYPREGIFGQGGGGTLHYALGVKEGKPLILQALCSAQQSS